MALFTVFLCIMGQWINLQVTDGVAAVEYVILSGNSLLGWNEGWRQCVSHGMTLAELNQPAANIFKLLTKTTDYINIVKDDLWIGLYDSAPSNTSKSNDGYTWATNCKTLTATGWSAWSSGEPQNTVNSWCVAMDRVSGLWKSYKCGDAHQVVCQHLLGSCAYLSASESCSLFNATINSMDKRANVSSDGCPLECETAVAGDGRECWGYSYNATDGCILFFNTNQASCVETFLSTFYQRRCLTVRFNYTTLTSSGSSGSADIPNVTCSSSPIITVPQQSTIRVTTSQYGTTDGPEIPSKDPTSTTSSTIAELQTNSISTTSASRLYTDSSAPSESASSSPGESSLTSDTTTIALVLFTAKDTTVTAMPESLVSSEHSSVTYVTDKSALRTTNKMCACDCRFGTKLRANLTSVIQEVKKITEELAVDITSLSSARRKKVSTRDGRTSAASLGFVGIVALFVTMAVIILQDIVAPIDLCVVHLVKKRLQSRPRPSLSIAAHQNTINQL